MPAGAGSRREKGRDGRGLARSSVACIGCRERKSKCDGKPSDPDRSCSNCKRLDLKCSFILDDARKWPSSKFHIKRLQDQITRLETLLKERTGDAVVYNPISSHESHHESHSQIDNGTSPLPAIVPVGDASAILSPPADDTVQLPFSSTSSTYDPSIDHTVLSKQSNHMNVESSSGNRTDAIGASSNKEPRGAYERIGHSHSGVSTESTAYLTPVASPEEILDWLSDNIGQFRVGEDGQIHYYGSTVDFQATPLLRQPVTSAEVSTIANSSCALAGFPAIQESLLELFWQYPHPFLQIPDKQAFLIGLRKGVRTPYFSQLLLTTMVLRTAHLSDSSFVRGLAGSLLERAKEQLYIELECPDLNTVLALLFLSNYVASQQRNGLGWIYMGIAGRLLIELGLNQDCSRLVSAGSMSKKEMEYRKVIFWSGFVNEYLWSISLGRPTSIRLSDVTVAPLSPLHPSFDTALLAAWAELCKIQGEISDSYNGARRQVCTEDFTTEVASLDAALNGWHNDLSDNLRWDHCTDLKRVPSLCILQMHFCTTMVILHRPLAAYRRSNTPPYSRNRKSSVDSGNSVRLQSRDICRNNAVQISQLLRHLHQNFGSKYLSSIFNRIAFISATTLVLHISAQEEDGTSHSKEERSSLKDCIKAIEAMAAHYPVAENAKAVLLMLMDKCSLNLADDDNPGSLPVSIPGNSDSSGVSQIERSLKPGSTDFCDLDMPLDSIYPNLGFMNEQFSTNPVLDPSMGIENFDFISWNIDPTEYGHLYPGSGNLDVPNGVL